MQYTVSYFLFHVILFCYRLNFMKVQAIIGQNVEQVGVNEYPNIACLARLNPQNPLNINKFCTGTFISHTHLLTASGCLQYMGNNTFHIIAESHDLTRGNSYISFWWLNYDSWNMLQNIPVTTGRYIDNDVLIIKIIGCIPPTINVAVISEIAPQTLLYGLDAVIVGFGNAYDEYSENTLRAAHVRIISKDDCEHLSEILQGYITPIDPTRYFCTIIQPHAIVTFADRGGPVFFFGILIGIHKETYPSLNGQFHSNKANIHVGMEIYQEFIRSLLAM